MSEFSIDKDEKEILFNPLNSYKIQKVEEKQKGSKQYLEIVLSYGEIARIQTVEANKLNPE